MCLACPACMLVLRSQIEQEPIRIEQRNYVHRNRMLTVHGDRSFVTVLYMATVVPIPFRHKQRSGKIGDTA